MKPILIVSVGPGRDDLLTIEAHRAIDRADAVFCAARHAVLAQGRPTEAIFPFDAAFARMAQLREAGLEVAVLVSGDAGLYSLMPRLTAHFGTDAVHVLPGVSALQAFSASAAAPWQDAAILSGHGRPLSAGALCHAARTNRRVFLFLDQAHDPAWIRAALVSGGLTHVRLTVGDRLSYADEYVGPAAGHACSPLCMAMLENDQPESGLPPIGLPDDAFIRGKTPMTKREIRIQLLSDLRLTPDATVWDVGAGTGSVTVECARQCPLGEVIAIEQNEDALSLIRQNIAHFCLPNVSVIAGHAPEALNDLPTPTHVFLGGTGHQTDAILDLLEAMNRPIRIAATTVTLESLQNLHERFARYADATAVQLSAARLSPVGSYTMFQAQNPVFLFAATIGGTL